MERRLRVVFPPWRSLAIEVRYILQKKNHRMAVRQHHPT
jgi:hypothetical protein